MDDLRKVLIFKETLLPPSETFVLAQMTSLQRYSPTLAGLERSKPSLPLSGDELLLSNTSGEFASRCAKLYRKTGLAPSFHKKLGALKPDLIHAHFASGGRTILPLMRRLGVPLVVTLHGSDVSVDDAKDDRYKCLADRASLFICVSEFIRSRALEVGFPPEKLAVHYIGIDRGLFQAPLTPQHAKRVFFVGRLVEKKGCEYLIRAMRLVQDVYPESELTIIGDGPLRPDLEVLARNLKVQCSFRGVQPHAAVQRELRETRVFCAPSVTAANGDSEGCPIVIAEAQAMGLPVVASRHAGIPEIVKDGVTGLLAPERDHTALAAALLKLLSEEGLWRRFRSAALSNIEQHFDLKLQTALLETLYDQALRSSRVQRQIAP
jgi:colanic acid/amylovoran biosynthesis glycosyltransferase